MAFDPMAVAIDWLDAYRAASISIVDLYADDGSLECGCASTALHDRTAITEYWLRRFVEEPAGELMDLQPLGENVVIRYRVPDGIVRAVLQFDDDGKISRSFCSTTQ
jgi:hypothetical protein